MTAVISKIAIIGAGPSGIVTAKALLAEGCFSEVVVYEQRETLGGAWLYSDLTKTPDLVPCIDPWREDGPIVDVQSGEKQYISPMYTYLYANTPRGIMEFGDKPNFPEKTTLFPTRSAILEYVQEYGEDVLPYMLFNTKVDDVQKMASGLWRVMGATKSTPFEQYFDAVVIASGHYDLPYIPSKPGLEDYALRELNVSHAKYFRRPEQYKDLSIFAIGNGPSAADIASQLVQYCKMPLLRSVRSAPNPVAVTDPKVTNVPDIRSFNADGSISLVSGPDVPRPDIVLFCTGYLYSFPMLRTLQHNNQRIIDDGARVKHLYRQIFYTPDPTLAFVGLPKQVIPFSTSQNQACSIARVWSRRLALPSAEEMHAEEASRLAFKENNERLYHSLANEDVDYTISLEQWTNTASASHCGMDPFVWTEQQRDIRRNTRDMKIKFLQQVERKSP